MNILWSSMLLLGIAYGALQGRMPEVTDGVIQALRGRRWRGGFAGWGDGFWQLYLMVLRIYFLDQ